MSLSDFAEQKPQTEWKQNETIQQSTTDTSSNGLGASVGVNPASTPIASSGPMTDEILGSILGKIGDIGQNSKFKILIYGDPGSTKSSFAGTAPNNLIYDVEDGLLSINNSPNGRAENVKALPFTGFDQTSALIAKLMEEPEELAWVNTLTIDSLSELHKRALAEVTEREWRKRPSSNRFVPETEHHQENNERIIRMVRALRDLNRNLIITAHARTIEPKNKPAKTFPDFSESLANKIEGFMDIVGYMEVKKIDGKPTPVMRVVSDGQTHAKNRLNLPEEIINPTWPQLAKLWEEKKNK